MVTRLIGLGGKRVWFYEWEHFSMPNRWIHSPIKRYFFYKENAITGDH